MTLTVPMLQCPWWRSQQKNMVPLRAVKSLKWRLHDVSFEVLTHWWPQNNPQFISDKSNVCNPLFQSIKRLEVAPEARIKSCTSHSDWESAEHWAHGGQSTAAPPLQADDISIRCLPFFCPSSFYFDLMALICYPIHKNPSRIIASAWNYSKLREAILFTSQDRFSVTSGLMTSDTRARHLVLKTLARWIHCSGAEEEAGC